MKRIFTLLVALFSLTAVFAQQGQHRYDNNDRRNTSTVYNSGYQNNYGNQSGYGSYGQQSNWNDHRGDQYGRDEHRDGYDQRMYDNDRRDRRYDDHDRRYNDRDRVIVTRTQTRTNLKTVAGALIIGGIIGALIAH